jgi:uncharacterized protein
VTGDASAGGGVPGVPGVPGIRGVPRVPGESEILALHERFAPNEAALTLVRTHCLVVAAVAAQLLTRRPQPLDAGLVHAGCLLHDIGVYRLYDAEGRLDGANYLAHGVLGEHLLRELGLPEVLCRFCSHHTGAGLTRDDVVRQRLPLPAADYLAETAEEELVMYADTFHSKSTPPVLVPAAVSRARLARFGAATVARFDALRERFGDPDLRPLTAAFGHGVLEA